MSETETPTEAPDESATPDKRLIRGVGSLVTLDYRTGAVHKTYKPKFAVRALYWLAFQAPFPYSTDRDALEASRERRVIVGLLTKYWFGLDMVAPVIDIVEDEHGDVAFVTELVRGHELENKYRARRFLKILTTHFIEAGLPTWQVSPHNPRSVGNLIEIDDGSYRIIDLESNLVAALTPMSAVTSAIRQKNFPNFDDIDTATLEGYLSKNGRRIREKLGGDDYLKLMNSAVAYAEYVKRWHSREPRVLGRVLGVAFGPIYFISAAIRRFKRVMASGQLRAEVFIRRGLVHWLNEGKMTQDEADDLRRALREPEVAQALNYIGVNMALNVIVFIPFLTSFIRFFWTLFLRLKAEIKGLITHRAPHTERDLHTLKVAIFGLVPKLGAGAYLLSGPLSRNRGLFAVGIDRVLKKTPFGLYRRMNLERIGDRVMASARAQLGTVAPTRTAIGSTAVSQERRAPMTLQVGVSIRRVVLALLLISTTFIVIDASMNLIEWNHRHTLERGYAEIGDLGCDIGKECFAPRQSDSLSVTFEKIRMRFDYDLEANVPTWYSAFLFSLCGLALLAIGTRARQIGAGNVVAWFGLAAIFFYFSIDDTAQFHELLGGDNSIGHDLNKHLGISFVTYDWVIPAFILMIVALPFFIPFGLKLPQGTFVLFVVAAFFFLFSQMGLETFAGSKLRVDTMNYHWESLIEDGPMKQGSLILFVFAMLTYYRDNLQGAFEKHAMVAELPIIRQLLSLPVLRLLRPQTQAALARS